MNYNRVPFMQTVHNSLEPWNINCTQTVHGNMYTNLHWNLYTNCTLETVHKLYTLTCTKTVNWDPYTNCTLGVPSVHRNLCTNCTTELVHKLLHHLNLTYTHHHVFCTMYCKKKYWYCVLKEFMLPLWYIVCMYALRCEKLKHLA